MTPPRSFRRVAVIGLGLLGGSVAAAAKAGGVAGTVAGASRSDDARAHALGQGWLDEAGEPKDAVRGADLVVLATPVAAMEGVLRGLAPALEPGAVVTDVGSVKGCLADTLPHQLRDDNRYVGSHPMAGSHERGVEHASADLFRDRVCVVTEPADPDALARVCDFWRDLGARVVVRDARAHDTQVAWTSHVPHAVAFAFGEAFGDAPGGSDEVVGAGFYDFTRIARSDPGLWSEILLANRDAVAAPLAAVGAALAELGRAIRANDSQAVERSITGARDALARVPAPPIAGAVA